MLSGASDLGEERVPQNQPIIQCSCRVCQAWPACGERRMNIWGERRMNIWGPEVSVLGNPIPQSLGSGLSVGRHGWWSGRRSLCLPFALYTLSIQCAESPPIFLPLRWHISVASCLLSQAVLFETGLGCQRLIGALRSQALGYYSHQDSSVSLCLWWE